ncbi:MAG TPA: DUF2911 domain-containing protein [Gemmatimonadales bacterium]|nr:DUF2911 domain-containing protein [Gemmatimonadales bacterium]
MRARASACVLVLAGAHLAGQDRGAWVTRLGNDTMALETYQRTDSGLRGEIVTRSPVTLHRIYTVTYGAGRSHFELVTHNIGGAPNLPMELKSAGDAQGPAEAPYLFLAAGLLEDVVRGARNRGGDTATVIGLPMTGSGATTLGLRFVGGDAVRLWLGGDGPFLGTLDRAGHLTHISGRMTTDKYEWERVPSLDLARLGPTFASRPIAQLSPRDTLTMSFQGTSLTVAYGRPSVRGRKIFGAMEPWGKVWRAGANSATILTITGPVVAAGTTIPAGSYSLWILPTPGAWTLIVNRETLAPCTGPCGTRRSLLSGTAYNPDSDLVRLPMTVDTTAPLTERFTISGSMRGDPTGSGATLTFAWEHTVASVDLRKP